MNPRPVLDVGTALRRVTSGSIAKLGAELDVRETVEDAFHSTAVRYQTLGSHVLKWLQRRRVGLLVALRDSIHELRVHIWVLCAWLLEYV